MAKVVLFENSARERCSRAKKAREERREAHSRAYQETRKGLTSRKEVLEEIQSLLREKKDLSAAKALGFFVEEKEGEVRERLAFLYSQRDLLEAMGL